MHFKYIFSLIALVISVGATLVVIGESKMNTVDRQKMFDKRPLKIMRDDKYLHNRSREMELAIKAGAVITNEKIEMILHEWLISVERRNGNEEASLIHFTPDMLSEENKDKFNKSILGIGINREEVIDKLKALNIAIDHSSEKITPNILKRLINPRFDMHHKSDMAHHWFAYFISKKNIDVNNWEKRTPMGYIIIKNNYDVATILVKYGYKPNDLDFELIQEQIIMVKENVNDTGTIDQEKALEALRKIEILLVENLNNRASEPPPSRGFFD